MYYLHILLFLLIWLQSMDLVKAAVEGPWTNNDRQTNMLIIIFLERCKRPLRLTAGKIFTLSLDTYTVVRDIFNYISV